MTALFDGCVDKYIFLSQDLRTKLDFENEVQVWMIIEVSKLRLSSPIVWMLKQYLNVLGRGLLWYRVTGDKGAPFSWLVPIEKKDFDWFGRRI